MISVYIPTPFRSFVGNRTNVEVEGSDVAEVLANLDTRSPASATSVTTPRARSPRTSTSTSTTRRSTPWTAEQRKLNDGDQVAVIPALAGGAPGDEDEPVAATP